MSLICYYSFTDNARLVNVAGHNADLALTGRDYARAVGAEQTRLVLLHKLLLHVDHVVLRNAFSDADDERHLGVNGLHDGRSCARRRHVDDRGRCACLLTSLF